MSIQTDSGVLVFTPHSRASGDDDSNSVPYPKNFKGIGILPTLTTEGSLESRAQVKDLLGCVKSRVAGCKKKCLASGSNYEGCSTCSAGKAYLKCKGKPPLRGKDFGSEYKPGPPLGRTMPPEPKKLTRKEKEKLREKIAKRQASRKKSDESSAKESNKNRAHDVSGRAKAAAGDLGKPPAKAASSSNANRKPGKDDAPKAEALSVRETRDLSAIKEDVEETPKEETLKEETPKEEALNENRSDEAAREASDITSDDEGPDNEDDNDNFSDDNDQDEGGFKDENDDVLKDDNLDKDDYGLDREEVNEEDGIDKNDNQSIGNSDDDVTEINDNKDDDILGKGAGENELVAVSEEGIKIDAEQVASIQSQSSSNNGSSTRSSSNSNSKESVSSKD